MRRPSPGPRTLGAPHLRAAAAAGAGGRAAGTAAACGTRGSATRSSISYHYDVSNTFYEHVLGPSMTYTCACYPTADATLEQAQAHKYDLVARKLGLQPGMRLLDVGCGWGGMVRHAAKHYGVQVLGVTLSREQAAVGARSGSRPRASTTWPRSGTSTTATCASASFDAVSSIGLIEHIGVRNYPAYFRFLRARLRPGGRLLNHGITRPDNKHPGLPPRGFIGRYVFPDGELTGSGAIVTAMEDAGLEVQHQENLRVHYAQHPAGVVRQPGRATGTSASPRRACRSPRSGASTWPAPGSGSSATGSSCTRCSPPAPRPTASPATRCATTSASSRPASPPPSRPRKARRRTHQHVCMRAAVSLRVLYVVDSRPAREVRVALVVDHVWQVSGYLARCRRLGKYRHACHTWSTAAPGTAGNGGSWYGG